MFGLPKKKKFDQREDFCPFPPLVSELGFLLDNMLLPSIDSCMSPRCSTTIPVRPPSLDWQADRAGWPRSMGFSFSASRQPDPRDATLGDQTIQRWQRPRLGQIGQPDCHVRARSAFWKLLGAAFIRHNYIDFVCTHSFSMWYFLGCYLRGQ